MILYIDVPYILVDRKDEDEEGSSIASLTSPKSEFGAQNIETILDAVAIVEEHTDALKNVSL